MSSILGIMDMIREDKYQPTRDHLLLLDDAVRELDEKIRSVVTCATKLEMVRDWA